ncbi:MAG: hypothetical protein JNM66_13075 [Bryobacterales bacterium]|nr:hypothetical protein [Bryobacterales bacterium]
MNESLDELPGLGLGSLSSVPIASAIARARFVHRLNSLARHDLDALLRTGMPYYKGLVAVGKADIPEDRSDFPYFVLRTSGVDDVAGTAWNKEKVVDILHFDDLAAAVAHVKEAALLYLEIVRWLTARNINLNPAVERSELA